MRAPIGVAVAVLLLSAITATPAQAITWSPCPATSAGEPSLEGFDCAKLTVPLDHTRPDGRTITLGLVKHPATRGTAQGTLLFNPGGPGDQGSVFLPALLNGFGPDLVRRFDIISWDPRGMGGMSTPTVRCFPSLEREAKIFSGVAFPPLTPLESRSAAQALGRMNRRCHTSDLALLRHVSTADSARDMDAIRRALGLQTIDYYGTSYGTLLGATYAAMFPTGYRHLVLDGAADPAAWMRARGGLSTFNRLGSGAASAKGLRTFLRICGSHSAAECAFSAGSPAQTIAKYDRLLSAAKAGLRTAEGIITANDIVAGSVDGLYLVEPAPDLTTYPGWTRSAQTLQRLWELSQGATTSGETGRREPGQQYLGPERPSAVICGESPNPSHPAAYVRQARRSVESLGVGSASWTWGSYCVDWPVRAAAPHRGPWTVTGRTAVVIGTTGDPATPYGNSVRARRLLGKARLITVDGLGHTALANPNSCVQRKVAAYLLDDRVPDRGAVCQQETRPFSG